MQIRDGARFESGKALPHCGVEQMVARLAHNQEVAGSSPAPAPNGIRMRKHLGIDVNAPSSASIRFEFLGNL